MPRRQADKQRLRDAQRAHILDAARRVFARKGPAATMDDVAAEAGVSHGLAYRYFRSKEAIFYAVVEQALQTPGASLDRIREIPGTPGERLRLLVTEFVESRRQPEIYLLLSQALTSEGTPDRLRDLVRRRGQSLQHALRQLILAAQATGEVAAGDPDQLARALLASVDGLTRWAALHPTQYKEHYPDPRIFLRMLKP